MLQGTSGKTPQKTIFGKIWLWDDPFSTLKKILSLQNTWIEKSKIWRQTTQILDQLTQWSGEHWSIESLSKLNAISVCLLKFEILGITFENIRDWICDLIQ